MGERRINEVFYYNLNNLLVKQGGVLLPIQQRRLLCCSKWTTDGNKAFGTKAPQQPPEAGKPSQLGE
jgi:hypothetical protein